MLLFGQLGIKFFKKLSIIGKIFPNCISKWAKSRVKFLGITNLGQGPYNVSGYTPGATIVYTSII